MFDKLIESNSLEADFKPRARYFTLSSIVVGILFLTAVVFSLYAQDIDLGTDNFDVAELLAPVAPDVPQLPEPRQRTLQNSTHDRSDLPSRQMNILRIDEAHKIPDSISVTPNKFQTRPESDFILSNRDSDSAGRPEDSSASAGTNSGTGSEPTDEPEKIARASIATVPPPPVRTALTPKRPVSIGVANGRATHLPKPPYSQAAIAMGAQGEVSVQITIDELGKVVSAKAVSGHIMLRGPAEKAAWSARFTPTRLSDVAVKVTGVIVYKFSR